MDLVYPSLPVAGAQFHFTTTGDSGRIRIVAEILDKVIWEGECPRPPCHEQIYIPEFGAGTVLTVTLTDFEGNVVVREIKIGTQEKGFASA